MRTRTSVILTGGLLVVFAAIATTVWWVRRPETLPTLSASGTVEATEIDASFKIAGRVIERPVDEGSRVRSGMLIARLESRELEAEVERLRASLGASQSRLPQLETEIALQAELTGARIAESRASLAAREEYLAQFKAGSRQQDIDRARAELREAKASMYNARTELARAEALFARELVAARERDSAQMALDVATERYEAARQRYDMTLEGPRVEEVRRAEADVRQARASLAVAQTGALEVTLKRQQLSTLRANVAHDQAALSAAETQLGYTTLASPQAGVVLRKHVEPGEMVAIGTPVVTIADLDKIWVKIYVPEPQLGRVKLGQPATVTTDSYPGKVYRGTLTFVNSEAEFTPKNIQTPEERVKLVFAVKVSIDNRNQELKPGMPADVTVHLE